MILRNMYHSNFIQYHDIYSWSENNENNHDISSGSENNENIIAVKMDWYDKTLADVINQRSKYS